MVTTTSPAELALRLHKEGTKDLTLKLNPGEEVQPSELGSDYCVRDSSIEFTSLLVRNRLTAECAFSLVCDQFSTNPGAVFDTGYQLWRHEIGHGDQASGRFMGMASEKEDVVALAVERIRAGDDVFDLLHLIEAALPHVRSLGLQSLIDLCNAKYEKTKNDLAGGVFHGALETWLGTHPMEARDLHKMVLSQLSDATGALAGNAILGLSKTDFQHATHLALVDAYDSAPLRAQLGIWALGRLLVEATAPEAELRRIESAIGELIRSETDNVRLQAIRSAAGALHATHSFDDALWELGVLEDQQVLCALARTLYLEAPALSKGGDLLRWIDLMPGIEPKFKGSLSELDHVLSVLAQDLSKVDVVLATLTRWVDKHGRPSGRDTLFVDTFPSTTNALGQVEGAWKRLVTDWLLSESRAHPASLSGVFDRQGRVGRRPILDEKRLDELDYLGLLFLTRRMLGFVIDHGQLLSLALSMLTSRDAPLRIYPILRATLVEEIGYDYPGSTIEACETAAKDANEDDRHFLQQAASALRQANEALNKLPRIKELRAPAQMQRQFMAARMKQMSNALEAATKDSWWRTIATEVPLKAGKGMFHYQEREYSPSTQLSSVSHSVELPRREVLDPVGNAIRMVGFRIAKRGDA